MFKFIKKIIFAASLFLIYLIGKELVSLYYYTYGISPYFAYGTFAVIGIILIYYVLVPIYKIIRIPRYYGPVKVEDKKTELIKLRMNRFRKNRFLIKAGFDFNGIEDNEEGYNKVIAFLAVECSQLRKRYVTRLFYSTAVSQNGFLDAVFILSATVNLVKEIFVIFNGRVSNKDLWNISKKLYYSVAIGGSEGIEYAAEEIFSKFATDSMKSIPFADKVVSSFADGFVNAALLTRISIITENYCKMVYIKNDRALYPSAKIITQTTKSILGSMKDVIMNLVRKPGKYKDVDPKPDKSPVKNTFAGLMNYIKH